MNPDFGGILGAIADRGLKSQVAGPKDYYDEEGLLVCGVCKKHRQMMKEFPAPTPGDPERIVRRKVACLCDCEEAAERAEAKREKQRRDMELVNKLKDASLMDSRFSSASFASYEITPQNDKILKLCRRYVGKFDEMIQNNQGLLFYGDVGTGKSYTAACIANELLKRRVPVVMTSLIKLIEIIQRGESQETVILNRMNQAKLVIFDDLGAERSTDYALERIYSIIDARYRRRLPMILTTNLTLKQMKEERDLRYSRIYDRIFECCYPVKFAGVSFRKRSANQRFEQMKKLLDD